MKRFFLLCGMIALALGATGSASAETIRIIASDNAWVRQDQPGNNPSEPEELHVRGGGTASDGRFAYLRFDLSPLADLATITSASLDLYWLTATGNSTVCVCALNDLADAGKGTTETTWLGNLTWNTRPDGLASLPNTRTSAKLTNFDFVKGAPAKLVSFDLTSALPGLLAADTNHELTVMLYCTKMLQINFASLGNTKDYAVPTLNVGYEPIPEPGTLALLSMALLGLGFYAWRKSRR